MQQHLMNVYGHIRVKSGGPELSSTIAARAEEIIVAPATATRREDMGIRT